MQFRSFIQFNSSPLFFPFYSSHTLQSFFNVFNRLFQSYYVYKHTECIIVNEK